ncbi:Uncharacterised protein [Streptococcus pneumoniae]|nr:Uncharacterised protein [Streptococcus pneumoniae]CKF29023.1 Uncharacterised protein [Streptococcus pneumoniae]
MPSPILYPIGPIIISDKKPVIIIVKNGVTNKSKEFGTRFRSSFSIVLITYTHNKIGKTVP